MTELGEGPERHLSKERLLDPENMPSVVSDPPTTRRAHSDWRVSEKSSSFARARPHPRFQTRKNIDSFKNLTVVLGNGVP